MSNIKTFRKGARVRYIGTDSSRKETWGSCTYYVLHKCGNSVVGYFPTRYSDGQIHLNRYSVPCTELEIV